MSASVCTDFEAELVAFGGDDDHVHPLVNYPPEISISNLVNRLKGVSSRMIRNKNYANIRNFGVPRYGRRLTLPVAAVVRLSPLLASTSNSSRRRASTKPDTSWPRPEGRGQERNRSTKSHDRQDKAPRPPLLRHRVQPSQLVVGLPITFHSKRQAAPARRHV